MKKTGVIGKAVWMLFLILLFPILYCGNLRREPDIQKNRQIEKTAGRDTAYGLQAALLGHEAGARRTGGNNAQFGDIR